MWQKWVNGIGDSLVGLNMIMNPQKFSLSNAKCNFQKSHMSLDYQKSKHHYEAHCSALQLYVSYVHFIALIIYDHLSKHLLIDGMKFDLKSGNDWDPAGD